MLLPIFIGIALVTLAIIFTAVTILVSITSLEKKGNLFSERWKQYYATHEKTSQSTT